MLYIIDGYNLIFSCLESSSGLQKSRKDLVNLLLKLIGNSKVQILLVFDGSRPYDEESGYEYFDHFNAYFSPKGQSADDAIIEYVTLHKNKDITVISSDKALCSTCRFIGAQTQKPNAFLRFLQRKQNKALPQSEEKMDEETEANMERLRVIFEKKFKEGR